MENFSLLRLVLFFTLVLYFVFDHFDAKQIKDEREEFLKLKTFELVHRVTTSALCLVAVAYFFYPTMNALYPVLAVALSFLYTEIFGKLYFRRKF